MTIRGERGGGWGGDNLKVDSQPARQTDGQAERETEGCFELSQPHRITSGLGKTERVAYKKLNTNMHLALL